MNIDTIHDQKDIHCCDIMERALAASEVAIVYVPKFREYGIPVLDGGSSFQLIAHCPWCGGKLPESLRHKWFDELERLGIDPGDNNAPEEYLSDHWWSRRCEKG